MSSIDELFAKLEQTSYGYLVHDQQRRRHLIATMMADSDDPIVREMGQQLRDGLVTPQQLLSVPEYLEKLESGYEKLAQIDLDELAEQVDEVRQRERDEGDR
jgi:hypothetical protein